MSERLAHALGVFRRLLRVGRGLGGDWPQTMVDDLRKGLEGSGPFPVFLTAGAESWSLGEQRVLEWVATEDHALARLARAHVHTVAFVRPPKTAEIVAVLNALTRDISGTAHSEGDVTLWLADAHCGFFEVYFSDPPLASHGTLDNKVMSVLKVLSQGTPPSQPEPVDVELHKLARETTESLENLTPWLTGAAVAGWGSATSHQAQPLAELLGQSILNIARSDGLAAAEEPLDRVASWIGAGINTEAAPTIAEHLFSPKLRSLALYTIKRDPSGHDAALAVLKSLHPSHAGPMLAKLCELRPSPIRAQAIDAVVSGGGAGRAAEILAKVDGHAARAIVGAIKGAASDSGTYALFGAATTYPDPVVRAQGLAWLASKDDDPVPWVEKGLADAEQVVRYASLYVSLTAPTPERFVPTLMAHMESNEFRDRSMEEKKLVVLSAVKTGGDRCTPALRHTVGRLNVRGDPRLDELRAAAAWGLAALLDIESTDRIKKLARGRRRSEAAIEHAGQAYEALSTHRTDVGDPEAQLRQLAKQLGIVDDPEASPTPSVPADIQIVVDRATPVPQEQKEEKPSQEVIDELLAAYSFDNIPTGDETET